MARPWYAFYPADYGRDTGHLSLTEHGAYRMLMDHYYSRGQPLENDMERLLHVCRARLASERRAVARVLAEFFILEKGCFAHPRIDAEIAKAAEVIARCSFAGKASAAKRQRVSNAGAADVATQIQPSQPQPQSQENTDMGFEEFWSAYPRREARGAARKAYDAACAKASPELLAAAARAYAARRDGQEAKFTRTPASWLAQECWLDDGAAPLDEAAVAAGWDGHAARLVALIGAAVFKAYFSEAGFAPGPPVRITIAKPHLRDLVGRKFADALRRAYGEFALCP